MYTEQHNTTDAATFFKDATSNQKYAMISLLLFLNRLDTTHIYNTEDIERITYTAVHFSLTLGITPADAIQYYHRNGLRKILDELRSMEEGMKTCYMLIGDGLYPSQEEKLGIIKATFGGYLFGLLAMPFEKYVTIVKAA